MEGMAYVNELTSKAIAYVWGLQDAGHRPARIKDMCVDWEFGQAYREHTTRFVAGEATSHMPIQDAWKSWRKHGLIFSAYYEIEPASVV